MMAVAAINANILYPAAPRLAKRLPAAAPSGLRRRADGQSRGTSFPLASSKEMRLSKRVAVSYDAPLVKAAFVSTASLVAKGEAFALGSISPRSLSGESGLMAIAGAEIEAAGAAQVGQLIQASAAGKASAQTGAGAHAKGSLKFGMDSLGLPSLEASAGAEAMAGAKASGSARGRINVLELIEFDVGGSAEAIAGAAAAIFGGLGYKDGRIWINSRAAAAAGAGLSGGADVGVGLGKIPPGVLQTTLRPVLAVPTLAITSVYKGVMSLFGADTKEVPDITDLPKVAVDAFKEGAKNLSDGVCEIGKQIGEVGSAIGKFFVDLF